MNLFFWKKTEENGGVYAPYEEIDAKRTSKLGYFFLLLMVIFGIWQGNQFLAAIQDNVEMPKGNSSCTERLANAANINFNSSYYYWDNKAGCSFTKREIQLGLDTAYEKALPHFTKIDSLEAQINQLETEKRKISTKSSATLDEYQTALIEEMAEQSNPQLDPQSLGSGYTNQQQSLNEVTTRINQLETEKNRTEQLIKELASGYAPAIKQAEQEYRLEVKKYQFLIFVISLLLVGPVFYFAWHHYHQARLRRSEYTIIWGGAVATFGFILAQVLLVFVYTILPQGILEAIFSLFAMFEFLVTLLYYLSFILVPLFFGFLIYLIQKKLYNKQAVLMRTIKSGHCPTCSLKLTPDMNHCPICSHQLKHPCSTCSNMTLTGGKFCSVCGAKQEIPT